VKKKILNENSIRKWITKYVMLQNCYLVLQGLTPKVPRPISYQKTLKIAMFVAFAQENNFLFIFRIQP